MLLIPDIEINASINDALTQTEYKIILQMWPDYEAPTMPEITLAMRIEAIKRRIILLYDDYKNLDVNDKVAKNAFYAILRDAQNEFNELIEQKDELTTRTIRNMQKRTNTYIIAHKIDTIIKTMEQLQTETDENLREGYENRISFCKGLISSCIADFHALK